jgi:hypothetical protein
MTELVYIAGPYTKGVWEYNLRNVIEAAEQVYNAGHVPFIPHTMTTLWALLYPKQKDAWLEIDLRVLEECDSLIRLDGDSEGAEVEVDFAQEHGITVYESIDEFLSG